MEFKLSSLHNIFIFFNHVKKVLKTNFKLTSQSYLFVVLLAALPLTASSLERVLGTSNSTCPPPATCGQAVAPSGGQGTNQSLFYNIPGSDPQNIDITFEAQYPR